MNGLSAASNRSGRGVCWEEVHLAPLGAVAELGALATSHVMTREEYIQQVKAVLDAHTERAANRLAAALAAVPPKAQKVEIQIFVDQDGEGFLDVRVGLVGPDLFVLNRAIADHAELFGTRMTEEGLEPALPLMEPGGEAFSVRDTLSDCAATWLPKVWGYTKRISFLLPIVVVSHDGYGAITPFNLNHPA